MVGVAAGERKSVRMVGVVGEMSKSGCAESCVRRGGEEADTQVRGRAGAHPGAGSGGQAMKNRSRNIRIIPQPYISAPQTWPRRSVGNARGTKSRRKLRGSPLQQAEGSCWITAVEIVPGGKCESDWRGTRSDGCARILWVARAERSVVRTRDPRRFR